MPQGTIKTYDADARTGIILDDQHNELAFDHDSFRTTGIRMFRFGQRVKFSVSGEGSDAVVRDLNILTL